MALARVKTWSAGEVLTASDLNTEFNNILNNANSLISPITGSLDMNGLELILDADADTSLTASTDDKLDLKMSGVLLFVWDGTVALPVNGLTFTAAASGNPAQIAANGTNGSLLVTAPGTGQILVEDDEFTIRDNAAPTKKMQFQVSAVTAGQTRTLSMPDNDVTLAGSVAGFAAGTVLVFAQSAAPTGWTKGVTHNDKALRVVTGAASSGGATAFTSVFGAGKSTGSHTLTTTDTPAHTHAAGTLAGSYIIGTAGGVANNTQYGSNDGLGGTQSVTISGSTASTGGGGGHSHTLSLDLQYVDVIIATKD